MARREPLNDDERRLLKITARMPLASVANLAPVLELDEERVGRMLGSLRRGGWVTSVVRGMTERRQHRWFLTRRGRGPALRHRSPASRAQGGGTGRRGWPPSTPRGNCPRTIGSGSPWTTTIPSTWRNKRLLPSPVVIRPTRTAARTTSTRPGPPRRGASRLRCVGWPCWSRSTAWPPT